VRDGTLLPLLAALAAAATAASCSGAGGDRGGALPEHATLEEPRRLDAPGEVADCRPCAVAVEPGAAPWAFAFEVAEVPGEGRAVRRVVATPPERGIAAAVASLEVPDMAPVPPGQGFFFGPQDLDADGYADLLLATDRGVANAYARYWRFDPAAGAFVDLGTFPILSVDPATRRITSYERGGAGGSTSTRTEYAWRGGRLEPVRAEGPGPAGEPG
jgi:hypothetical protein